MNQDGFSSNFYINNKIRRTPATWNNIRRKLYDIYILSSHIIYTHHVLHTKRYFPDSGAEECPIETDDVGRIAFVQDGQLLHDPISYSRFDL